MMRIRWATWVLAALASIVLWGIVYATIFALTGCGSTSPERIVSR